MHLPPIKSETKPITLGNPMELFDFVPLTGPGGGRYVVDRFIVCVSGVVTVATALLDGRDVARMFSQIVIEQRDGRQRWNLSGQKSRLASIWFNGIERHQEHGNVAIGAGQAIDYRLVIPMRKPMLVRPNDFSLPSDVFRKIILNYNTLGGWATGTSVLSAPTLNAYVLAEGHEEDTVEFKAEDLIKSVDFNSSTQAKLALTGTVHDLFVMKEDTTAGGALITAITDARLEDLGVPLLTRQDLVHAHRVKRWTTASGPTTPATERYLDPVQSGQVLPLLTADWDTSLWDGKLVSSMKIDLGTGLAGASAISREIVEKSQASFNAQASTWQIAAKSLRMKTAGNTRKSLGAWKGRSQLVGVWEADSPLLQAANP